MSSFEIITDSAVNLPDALRTERNIHVIPFRYLVAGREYDCLQEGIPFPESAKKFYALLGSGVDI